MTRNNDAINYKYGKISDIVKKLMKDRNINGRQLAKELNLSTTAVRSITLELTSPQISTVQKMADFFDVTPNQLLGIDPIVLDNSIPLLTDKTYHQVIFIEKKSIKDIKEKYSFPEKTTDVVCAYQIATSHYGALLPMNSVAIITKISSSSSPLALICEEGSLFISEEVKEGSITYYQALITKRTLKADSFEKIGYIQQVIFG
jgi:transcriptional regulator with XRE-family HTH domain